jgi:hypothetical protein
MNTYNPTDQNSVNEDDEFKRIELEIQLRQERLNASANNTNIKTNILDNQ